MSIRLGVTPQGVVPVIGMDDDKPSKCPSCGKPENIKQVCGHCKYEYPEDEDWNGWVVLGVIVVLIVLVWLGVTILHWLVEQNGFNAVKPTLFDVFRSQWEFVRNLRIW